ncbi:MAG: prolyl oligopeptidase family serine peptidase [Planctomycetota bacterium]
MKQRISAALVAALALITCYELSAGEGPKPPPKKAVLPDAAKVELEKGLTSLGKEIDALKVELKDKPALLVLIPDIQIFHNAVRFALEDDLFFENPKTKKISEFDTAKKLLAAGEERAKQLRGGHAPWTEATGPVVRGYVSKLDGTTIPYGINVPASFKSGDTTPRRVDFWFVGRDENLSELKFIGGRLAGNSEFPLENGFVLHVYGRRCNAYKFAGEMDVLESLDHVKAHYPVDEKRVCVRGFSMGGAATWHIASHYAGRWAAANPGAGFVDVKNYQGLDKKGVKTPWYEEKLWHWYDSLDYAINLTNTTLVAYSGEIDTQKAAADLMEKTLKDQGVKMTHIVGPQTGHKYEPKAKIEVAKLVDTAATKGRDPLPKEFKFTTFTLKYNTMNWVTIDALEKHWERATVEAKIVIGDKSGIVLTTSNVTALTLNFEKGTTPFGGLAPVILDTVQLQAPVPHADKSMSVSFVKNNGKWDVAALGQAELRKCHNLQGPIDDAFMDSFMMVRPTGTAINEKAGAWAKAEMAYASKEWRRQLRGEVRVKNDSDITDADIAAHNLILWGDPSSNKILAKIADKLPIKWSAQGIEIGAKKFAADSCVPVLIYPNPLNPKKYIVINSGFTFAEFLSASNSQQTPKLPDWAVLDMSVSNAKRLTEGVKDAGFFGERWELLKDGK